MSNYEPQTSWFKKTKESLNIVTDDYLSHFIIGMIQGVVDTNNSTISDRGDALYKIQDIIQAFEEVKKERGQK